MLVSPADFNDRIEAMEVESQGETLSTSEDQSVTDLQTERFTWILEKFSEVNVVKYYSDSFEAGGYKWRVLLFPKGKAVDHLSVYLVVADSARLPYGWSMSAHISLSVINQCDIKTTVKKDTKHQFNAKSSSWGFHKFMPLRKLSNLSSGYLVDDTLIIKAEVNVPKARPKVIDAANNEKKETVFVGLKNHGATGYLNTLLQTLYHLPYFRKSLYQMPTSEDDVPSVCVPLALQSLFYKMQCMGTSVDTEDLTKSFGWGEHESSLQHDVQELNRVLCEKLEDKMKGTAVEGTTQQLFEGHRINYIECLNVDYKSTLKDSFYDLQLNIKGCKNVYESFDKYIRVENLEDENKYHADCHGLQDARKGVLFIDFPPVLQLQLKRFEYDLLEDTVVKIHDRYEFPLRLDLDRDHWKYLSPDADRSVRNLYTLYSVLVHSGGGHDGHYYAFIRPALADQWYEFDDEHVAEAEQKTALEDQYGGEKLPPSNQGFNKTPSKFAKCTNAYVLVYIRECDKDKITCNVDERGIVKHLQVRLQKEQEEKEKKRKREERAVAHVYIVIKVAQESDLEEQIGKDIHFDLVDHNKVRSFRMKNQALFTHFKEEVAKELGIPVVCQRFWLWGRRENHTYRPNRPVNEQEELQTVGRLDTALNNGPVGELELFLEVSIPFLGHRIPAVPSKKTKKDLLLFFKLYNPEKEELRYVGRTFVKSCGKPMDILHTLNHMAGFAPGDEVNLYEEVRFEPIVMCDPIDKNSTFLENQLGDGDIICYQRALSKEEDLNYRYSDVPSFLDYTRYRQNRDKVREPLKIYNCEPAPLDGSIRIVGTQRS